MVIDYWVKFQSVEAVVAEESGSGTNKATVLQFYEHAAEQSPQTASWTWTKTQIRVNFEAETTISAHFS